jgi:ATP-dependent DNA helicase RecG
MDDEEIAALIRGDESDRVERKESLTDKVREAICAFANDLAGHQRPAVVVIGQRDDRSCAGLTIDDRLLTQLAGIRVESTFGPFPSIDVRALTVDGCHVAAIIVHPSSSPPVRYAGRI